MTQLVPADQIELLVGALRSPIDHLGRADEIDQTFYILHSAICLENYPDLRACPYSIALDKGITVNHDQRNIPLELDLDVDAGGPRIVIVGPVRACRECLCTEDHACTRVCTWATADLCSACVAKGAAL